MKRSTKKKHMTHICDSQSCLYNVCMWCPPRFVVNYCWFTAANISHKHPEISPLTNWTCRGPTLCRYKASIRWRLMMILQDYSFWSVLKILGGRMLHWESMFNYIDFWIWVNKGQRWELDIQRMAVESRPYQMWCWRMRQLQQPPSYIIWLVVGNIFYFPIYWE